MANPNLFLIGAPKSGTTFLHDILSHSDEIFAPFAKEPAHLLVEGRMISEKGGEVTPLDRSFSRKHYLELFLGGEKAKYRIDASTHYLSSPETAERIFDISPKAKVVAVLREPVSRAYSHYLMGIRDGFISESFLEALDREKKEMDEPQKLWAEHYRMARRSLYLEGVQEFYRVFGSNFRIYRFEDVKDNPDFILSDLGEFLGIDLFKTLERISNAEKNPFAVDRYPSVTKLVNKYRRSSVRVMINRATPSWARDFLRNGYDNIRLKKAEKPRMTREEKDALMDIIEGDYERTLEFAKERGIIREKASSEGTRLNTSTTAA